MSWSTSADRGEAAFCQTRTESHDIAVLTALIARHANLTDAPALLDALRCLPRAKPREHREGAPMLDARTGRREGRRAVRPCRPEREHALGGVVAAGSVAALDVLDEGDDLVDPRPGSPAAGPAAAA